MIPTLPGTGDIPVGPERPEPTEIPRPTVVRFRPDDLEELKRAMNELRARLENLQVRVERLESGGRIP